MTRLLLPLPLVLIAALLTEGCSTRGADRSPPPPPPSSGAGPFRPVRPAELGNETGHLLEAPDTTVQSGMIAGDHLFYAAGTPAAIHRSGPAPLPPYGPGPVTLEASEPWEGEEVFDPWAVVLEDGRTRLYYAGSEGIGLAEAPAPDGAFTRTGQLLAGDPAVRGGAVPRRPTVVPRDGGGWLLYYEVGDAIAVAQSEDGASFTHDRVIDLELPEEAQTVPEVAVGAPGAVVAITPVGRRVTRLYFTSERDDGTRVLGFAASLDGLAFERSLVPPVQSGNPDFAAPLLLEDPVTLLLYTADEGEGPDAGVVDAGAPDGAVADGGMSDAGAPAPSPMRALVGGIAPATAELR
ncbi:MAG: hypothetical protein ACOCV4_07825 [Myxococcota bacterium]